MTPIGGVSWRRWVALEWTGLRSRTSASSSTRFAAFRAADGRRAIRKRWDARGWRVPRLRYEWNWDGAVRRRGYGHAIFRMIMCALTLNTGHELETSGRRP